MEPQNKVIIIGTDHHNVLATVRCFGVNHIKPYGIIVKSQDDSPLWTVKSRYWKKTWVVNSKEQICDVLANNFISEKHKPVIICCSDEAMSIVDSHLDLLKQKYIVPGIMQKQGFINCLMDKMQQSEFLFQNRIPALESFVIDIQNDISFLNKDHSLILKPIASIEGDKKDITICDNAKEVKDAIKVLSSKGYKKVLAQEYLKNKTEYLLCGSVSMHSISFTVCRNIRQWPIKTGSGSYSQLIKEGNVIDFAEELLHKLQALGFLGPIDIEIFGVNDSFFVNEINWRSSGRTYVNLYNRVYSLYYYYLDVIGMKYNSNRNEKSGFAIFEGADIRNALIAKTVSVPKWIVQLLCSKSYALWFIKDLKPTFIRYKYYLKKMINLKTGNKND